MMRLSPLACSLALACACTLGNDEDIDSPYASASIELSDATAVADGLTPVTITITGQPGTELTLFATGASFVAPDPGSAQEKTVFLRAEDGVGKASAAVVATVARVATVAFKVERIRSARDIEFQPVRLAAGTPRALRMQPGQVVHEVCVAVNSSRGSVQVEALSAAGSFGPNRVAVRQQAPAELPCPTEPVDEFGWRGYAAFTWATAVDFAQVTLSYQGPGEDTLATDILSLHGQSFPGYQVSAAAPTTTTSWTAIEVTVAYPAVGELSSGPAAGVSIGNIRFIPEGGPAFLGSSSGGAQDEPITDATGRVTLFFDTANATSGATFALFVTPQNGATVYLTDIVVP
jgi:hypothetical protein